MSFGKEKVWNWQTKPQGNEQPDYVRQDQEAKYNEAIDFLDYGAVSKQVGFKEKKPDIRNEGPTGT